MKLNIYNVSHPILKILSNITKQTEENSHILSYYYKNIGLLLTYEVLRKYVVTKPVYIKCLYSTKLLNLISKDKKYKLLTNLHENYEMITEIKALLPNIDIIDTSLNNAINVDHTVDSIEKTEILILKKKLNNINVSSIIEHLHLEKKIPICNIKIVCIIAYQNILTTLSYKHPELTIYTIEIGYN